MHQLDKITDIIAADEWRYQQVNGQSSRSRIEVGRPQPAPDDSNGDWCCPIFIEGFTEDIVLAYGVGPVDALMNALMLVRSFADQIGPFTPRASDHPEETTP